MASVPSEPGAVLGRLDASGRLIDADPKLEKLQREAGAAMGQPLALPQIADIAELARQLGTAVSRPAVAASAEEDIDLWVTATPEGDEIALTLDQWSTRPARGPRLAAILGGGVDVAASGTRNEWAADEELRVISLSPRLAEILGVEAAEAAGAPLTRLFRLEENDDGEMPLISALASRQSFSGQRARSRANECILVLAGEVVTGGGSGFAGFRGSAAEEKTSGEVRRTIAFDRSLNELLRSPIGRIIASAEQIIANADGPLANEYADYGNDIASAARHLMSVVQGMSEDQAQDHGAVDLAALSAEAVVMLESSAEERGVELELLASEPLRVLGEERAVIQIVVNLIANAIRHSPPETKVRLTFTQTEGTVSVTVADEGPGISAGDEQRIFERFERAQGSGGTGLGLAISRRLARSMGGDVSLDSAPGEGARFTLTLPAA